MKKTKLIAPWMLVALFGLAGAGCATNDEPGYGANDEVGYGEGAVEAGDEPGVVDDELGVDEPDLDGQDQPGLD